MIERKPRITTEKFIEKAKSCHGNQYDYSNAVYVNAKTDVKIICAVHGVFPQTPSNHTNKTKPKGCPKCGGSYKLDFRTFVDRAREIHGRKYQYPRQEIVNARTKIKIVCREKNHGAYYQIPDSHLRGAGCSLCGDELRGRNRKLEEEELNHRLMARCGESIGQCVIEKNTYSGMNQKANVLCSVHGKQRARLAGSLLVGPHPCLRCSGFENSSGYTTKTFEKVLFDKFGKNIKFKKFSYLGKNTEIIFNCSEHGEWSIIAGSVRGSNGCPSCARQSSQTKRTQGVNKHLEATREKRLQEWTNKAEAKHDWKYDYSRVTFNRQKTSVEIGCPFHGFFIQVAATHLISGCRKCADEDLKGRYDGSYIKRNPTLKEKPAILYYLELRFESLKFFKVGITTTTIKQRMSAASAKGFKYQIKKQKPMTLENAIYSESLLLNMIAEEDRVPVERLSMEFSRESRIGRTECFTRPLKRRELSIFADHGLVA